MTEIIAENKSKWKINHNKIIFKTLKQDEVKVTVAPHLKGFLIEDLFKFIFSKENNQYLPTKTNFK